MKKLITLLYCFILCTVHADVAELSWNTPNLFSPAAAHWIAEISPVSDTLVLEDGSTWHINPSYHQSLLYWKNSDPVVITQNTSWFSQYNYKIVNKNTNASVEATMSLGSLLGGQYTHKIAQIDYFSGEILLENGSHWAVADKTPFSQWVINDTIIIGVNSSSFSNAEYILIDIEANNFARSNISHPPIASHQLAECSPYGDTVVLEDGSVWHTDPSGRDTLLYFQPADIVVITQNTSWLSSYKYMIVNKTTNTKILANMSLGPLLNGSFTHKIAGINLGHGEIILENGSRWMITDRDLLSQWAVNDTIIIGINNSWFSNATYLLINVEANNFVRTNYLY